MSTPGMWTGRAWRIAGLVVGAAAIAGCTKAGTRPGASPPLVAAPMPAPRVAVPTVAASSTRVVAATSYVLVKADGTLELGMLLAAATSNQGVLIASIPPTAPVAAADLAASIAALHAPAVAPEAPADPCGDATSDRAEGQYKLQPPGEDGTLADAQDAEAARNAGVLGSSDLAQGGAFASLTGTGDVSSGFDDSELYGGLLGDDGVAGDVVGTELAADAAPADATLVIADRAAAAQVVIDALRDSGGNGLLAVSIDGGVHARAFVIGFGLMGSPGGWGQPAPSDELVVKLGPSGASLDLQRGLDRVAAGFHWNGADDAAAIAVALGQARYSPASKDYGNLRVWFDGPLTVGHLVEVLDAVHGAGAIRIAIGAPTAQVSGWGTIGTGRYGTIGHGSGTGTGGCGGYGVGSGGGGCGGMHARSSVPSVRIGQPAVTGDLDPAIIRRYIKRNINKITYCYEKQLLSSPTLEGTVTTTFTIGTLGVVSSATATGVDPAVAACIKDVLLQVEFPKPKGGGTVDVSYPFTLHPTGG